MTRIVAALDDSAIGPPTLAVARELARLVGAEVEAMHIVEGTGSSRARAVATDQGVAFEERSGVVEDVLVDTLDAPDVVAGVLGARRPAADGRPAGRTATAVMQRASKPVVVVPPGCRAEDVGPFANVLVPLDGTVASSRAVRSAVALLAETGAHVVVLHVFVPETTPKFWDKPEHEVEWWGAEFLQRYCQTEGADIELRAGDPGQVVAAVAGDPDIDLVALGWSQDLSAGRATTVREVLSTCSVPVLLLPVDGRDHDELDPSPKGRRVTQVGRSA